MMWRLGGLCGVAYGRGACIIEEDLGQGGAVCRLLGAGDWSWRCGFCEGRDKAVSFLCSFLFLFLFLKF